MLFFEFYGYEKNSREIDVSRMYLMIWVISFYPVPASVPAKSFVILKK